MLIKFIYLSIKDMFKNTKKDISGVWFFCGLYGTGKTLSMTREAYRLHRKGIKVYSNYGLSFQDGNIIDWRDMLEVPNDSVICLDEIQNTFHSRNWKSMPLEFVTLLTQNRKKNIRIMGTAQIYEDMDRELRDLAKYIIQCKKIARLEINTYYDQQGYKHTINKRISGFREYFIIEDYYFNLYDTYEFIEKLKGLQEYKKVSS